MDLLSMIIESRNRSRYRTAVLQDNPIAYWRLGESSGTVAADVTNNYTGTYVGSPTLGLSGAVAGNTAVGFNGSSQYVDLGNPSAFSLTTGTCEAWVNVTSLPSVFGTIFARIRNNTFFFGSPTLVVNSTGTIRFTFQDGSSGSYFDLNTVDTISIGSWFHIVATYNASVAKIFINGIETASAPVVGTITAGVNYATSIGARRNQGSGSWERFLDASIDEVAIYPTVLSPERILAHYYAGIDGVEPFDSDALDYFNRVEAAGSTINATNKNAINQFIVGCKADGNWTKIKASCILAGADTLSGALVPLVGTAPTNVGFVAGDYSTTAGLLGGTARWLDTGRADNADPQDNCHLAAWVSAIGSGTTLGIIGSNINPLLPQRLIWRNQTNCNEITGSAYTIASGFLGISRGSPSGYLRRNNLIDSPITQSSTGTSVSNLAVFARNTAGANLFNGRLSFYSIGESINLGLLDTRLARLMNSLRSSSYDADALAYFAAITAAGSSINENNKNAVNEFIIGCKADGNWNKIKASCILAGADNLTGALVPLVGTAPTNFNFPEENYSRTNGLISNGTSSYLNSNRNDSADTKDNTSMCLCITQHSSENLYYASYTNFNGVAGRVLSRNGPSGVAAMCNNGGASATVPHSRTTATLPAFVGISRSNPTDYSFRYGGVTDTVVKTSGDPAAAPIHIFKQGNNTAVNSYSNVRLSFYSIGEALVDLALLDIRVTKLMNSLI